MILQTHSWTIYGEKHGPKDTCTPMFIAALFTIAKTWNQPKCPLTDEWIKKMWYIYIYIYIHTYTVKYYSAIKKRIEIIANVDKHVENQNSHVLLVGI